MNVTPMIDILLVLIIIFMMLAPERSAGLDARIPQPANGTGQGREVVVSVAEDGSLKINTQPVELENLETRLRQVFSLRPDGILFVDGARKADFAAVAHVLDIARGAGIAQIALMPKSR